MCFGRGSADKVDQEGAAKSREIEKMIRADEKKAAREVKLLLLGRSIRRRTHTATGRILIDMLHRCWREWKVDGAQADAIDICSGVLQGRKG